MVLMIAPKQFYNKRILFKPKYQMIKSEEIIAPIEEIQPVSDAGLSTEMTGEGLIRKSSKKNDKLRKFISLKIK